MLKSLKEQTEFLSTLDAILMAMEMGGDIDLEALLGNINVSANPFDFLLQIIIKFVGKKEMEEWLVKIITETLPVIETGVKGILLANIKSMTSCNIDPWIPSKLRKEKTLYGYNNKSQNGMVFNPYTIDYKGILKYSPISEEGQGLYHGVYVHYSVEGDPDEEIYTIYANAYERAAELWKDKNVFIHDKVIKITNVSSVHELARANDFNAFLWYVIRQGNFTVLEKLQINDEDGHSHNLLPLSINYGKEGKLYYATSGTSSFYTSMLSLCLNDSQQYTIEKEPEDGGDITFTGLSQLIPFSSTNNSANWYVNRGTYFNYLKPKSKRVPREFENEHAICNLAFEKDDLAYTVVDNKVDTFYPQGNLRFTILPAPGIHKPYILDLPFKIVKFLYDEKGNPNKDGKYSVNIDPNPIFCTEYGNINTHTTEIALSTIKGVAYKVKSLMGGNNEVGYMWVNTANGKYEFKPNNKTVILEDGTTDTTPGNYNTIYQSMYACYPGLTVYEFNYDFVMGMQLFDAKVMAKQLVETCLGSLSKVTGSGGLDFSLKTNKTETAYQMRIAEIIKQILEADAYEVSDCFFTFSNEEYDNLLNEAERKRANGYAFADSSNKMVTISTQDVYNILNEFDDNATLQENQEVITRAFNSITANITGEVLPEDKYNVECGIIFNLIKSLTMSVMDVILSPKVVLLIMVNKQLMEDENGSMNILQFDEFLKSISGLIINIVVELRDMMLQYLMDWVMQLLSDIIAKLAGLLFKEQLRFYQALLARLLEACKLNFPLFGHRKLLDSQLDMVNYADIIAPTEDGANKPMDSNC